MTPQISVLAVESLLLMPKVVKLCTTSPPLSLINTMLNLSKSLATLTFLSRMSYRDIFSAKGLLCCHVPGCHESALLDTVSRSRCEPHASNPKLRLAYYTPNHLTLNNWELGLTLSLWSFIGKMVSLFTRKQTCKYCMYSSCTEFCDWTHFAPDI